MKVTCIDVSNVTKEKLMNSPGGDHNSYITYGKSYELIREYYYGDWDHKDRKWETPLTVIIPAQPVTGAKKHYYYK